MSRRIKKSVEDAIGVANTEDVRAALAKLNEEESEDELMSNEEIKQELEYAKKVKDTVKSCDVPDFIERTEELDELSERAAKYFEDIMDKAFNSQDKHAAELFNSANAILKTALDGKRAIIDAQIKSEDLRIKEKKLDQNYDPTKAAKVVNQGENVVANRNELLKGK